MQRGAENRCRCCREEAQLAVRFREEILAIIPARGTCGFLVVEGAGISTTLRREGPSQCPRGVIDILTDFRGGGRSRMRPGLVSGFVMAMVSGRDKS